MPDIFDEIAPEQPSAGDIFDQVAPDTAGGGDIFDQLAPEADPIGGLSPETIARLKQDFQLKQGAQQMGGNESDFLRAVVNSFVPDPPTALEVREADLAKRARVEPIPLGTRVAAGLDTGIRQGLATPGRLVHGAADLALGAVGAGNTAPARWNADMLRQYAAYEAQMAARDRATFGDNDIANQLASGTGRAVTELPLYLAPGFGAANPAQAVARSSAAGGVVGGGTQYAQDRGEGRGRLDAATYGTASGLITALTTRAFGATGAESIFKKEGIEGIKNRLLAVLKGSALESPEELIDQTGQDILERISRNPEKPIDATIKEVLMAGAVGALVGGGVTAATQTAEAGAGLAQDILTMRDPAADMVGGSLPERAEDNATVNAALERLNRDKAQAPTGDIFDQVASEPLSQSQPPESYAASTSDKGLSNPPAAVQATSPDRPGTSPEQRARVRAELLALPGANEDLRRTVPALTSEQTDAGLNEATKADDVPATKADLKALADFIQNGGANPFAKPSGQPDATGKPPQTITGSNVQTGTAMPVSPQPASVGGQAAGGAKFKPGQKAPVSDDVFDLPTQAKPLDVEAEMRAIREQQRNSAARAAQAKRYEVEVRKEQQRGITEADGLLFNLVGQGIRLPYFAPPGVVMANYKRLKNKLRGNGILSSDEKQLWNKVRERIPDNFEDDFGVDGEVLKQAYAAAEKAGLSAALFERVTDGRTMRYDLILDELGGKVNGVQDLLQQVAGLATGHAKKRANAKAGYEGMTDAEVAAVQRGEEVEVEKTKVLDNFDDSETAPTPALEQQQAILDGLAARNPNVAEYRGLRAVGPSNGRRTLQLQPGQPGGDRGQSGTPSAAAATVAELLEKLYGVRIFTVDSDGLAPFNGVKIIGSKIVLVHARSDKPMLTVAGHELLHHLKETHPGLYREFRAAMLPLLQDVAKYQAKLERAGYGEADPSGRMTVQQEQAIEELLGDFTGDSLSDPTFLNALARQEPRLFQRFARVAIQWLDKLLARLKVPALRRYNVDEHISDLEAARAALRDMLVQGARETQYRKAGIDADAGQLNAEAQSREDEAPFSRPRADEGDMFGFAAPESVAEQRERLAREKQQADLAKQKEKMQERAGARLIGKDLDTTAEMFGGEARQDKAGQGALFSKPRPDDKKQTGSKRERNAANYIRNLLWKVGELEAEYHDALKTLPPKSYSLPDIESALFRNGEKRDWNKIIRDEGDTPHKFAVIATPFEWAKQNHGTTDDVNEAGYVLPSGEMLDFSERRHGGGGDRSLDHRNIQYDGRPSDGYEAMRKFIEMGAIRIDKSGAVDIGKMPTSSQLSRLRELGESAGSLTVDLLDGKRKAAYTTENIERGLGMMRRFYSGEDLPEYQALFSRPRPEDNSEMMRLQAEIAATQAELMAAIRAHIAPPDGTKKAAALAAKNAAAAKLRRLIVAQLKLMVDVRNLDAARSPEETANLISQTVDLLNSIQDEISERQARSEETPADLLKLRTDLQERLMMLKGWTDDQTDENREARSVPMPRRDDRFTALEAATDPERKTFGEWWQTIKNGLRYLTSPIPELPLTGERAEKSSLFRRGYRLFAVENNRVRQEAAERVNEVLEPLTKLGRTPADNEALRRYYRLGEARERAAMDEPKRKALAAEMRRLEETSLNKDPFNLFRRLVLYKDLRWRGTYLKNDQGKAITLPMGLTVDEVGAELRRLYALIEAHKDGLAITEALRRHYTLTDDLQKSILAHGEIIPESLRNPLYFPHHVIDSWSGNIARVRPSTEEDFRKYLIAPTGSAKLIQTDYLKAMYLHTADVLAHNARVDLVDKYWKPYDIADQLKAQHGDKWNLPWNIPPGYKLFSPFKKLPLRMDYVLSREVLADKLGILFNDGDLRKRMGETGLVLKVKPEDLAAALVAGEKIQWALPAEIADALNGIAKREAAASNPGLGHAIGLPFRAVNNFWKKTKLFAPWNWIRYEYGNLSTDAIDKVLAADPGAAKHLGRAAREVWQADQGEQSPEFKAAAREGVFDTITAGEAGELTKLPEFKAFLTGSEARWDKVRSFLARPMRGSKFREAVFRYAKFLADVERLRAGNEPVYAGAFHGDIEALGEDVDGQRRLLDGEELIYAKAAEISLKTYGDYNSLGVAGQWLRQYAVPFWSWQDVNFRYHANQLRNIADGLLTKSGPELNTARKAALRFAGVRVVSTLVAIGLAKELWNQFGGPMLGLWDDDDDLEGKLSEADRRRGHILLGKDDKGQAMVVYTPSAWSDVAEWVGGQNMKRLFMEYARGQITLDQWVKDYAKQLPGDVVNKIGQSLGPLVKAPYEAISGKATFPDVLDQRSIPESEQVWRLVGTLTDDRAVNVLRAAFDADYYSQPALEQLQQIILQIRRRDPENWAYYEAREDAADWKEAKTGKKFEQGSYDAPEAQALRNFRKSIYRGDVANAERFYSRLLGFGYTAERLDASIRNQAPLADLNEAERAEYTKTLTAKQRQELELATKYYNRIKALDGRERQLFPRKGQKAQPKPELLRQIVTDQTRNK